MTLQIIIGIHILIQSMYMYIIINVRPTTLQVCSHICPSGGPNDDVAGCCVVVVCKFRA